MTDTEIEYHAVAKTEDLDDGEVIAVSVRPTDTAMTSWTASTTR